MAKALKRREPVDRGDPDQDADPGVVESLADEVSRQAGEERAARVQLTIEELLDQCSSNDGEVAFKSIDAVTRGENHLERIPVDSVGRDIHEFARARYGGGRYKALFYARLEGEYRLLTQRIISIDVAVPPGEFYRSQEKRNQPEKEGTAALIETILEKMNASRKGEMGTAELLLLMMKQQQESSNQMLTMFTTVIGAMSKQGGGSSQGIDMLNALAVFDKLKGNSGEMVRPVIDMMEFARKLMVDKARKDSGEEGSPWADMLAQALTAVMARMSGGQMPQLQPPQEEPMPAGPAPTIRPMPEAAPVASGPGIEVSSPTVEQPQPANDDMKLMHILPIKAIVPAMLPRFIVAIEESHATPEDAFEMLNNPLSPSKLTDDQYDDLLGILRRENWVDELFGGADKIAKHKAWFEKLRELILKAEDAPESEGTI